jgi:phospholipid/cholesterol/gamma-HCH transport system substrate-binding protein
VIDVSSLLRPATVRLLVVVAFTALCAAIFAFLWVNSGGKVPGYSPAAYRVAVDIPRVANLVYFGDVMIAGVRVGKIAEIAEAGDHAHVTMELDPAAAPLHEGAVVRVRAKSLIEETFLEITDGSGPAIADSATLPAGSARIPTQVNDVLTSLDEPTRESLGSAVRAAGLSTADGRQAVAEAVSGLGLLGREGHDALDALAAQSEDLKRLTGTTAAVLAALNTQQGRIAELVTAADDVTAATANRAEQIGTMMRELPPVLTSARGASDDLRTLAGSLAPVAADLDDAAADLSAALVELPGTAADLRATLPALDGTLDRAPATLDRVPGLTDDLDVFAPPTSELLRDVNPALAYLRPYASDVVAIFQNFGAAMSGGDARGHIFRILPLVSEQTFKGHPVATDAVPLRTRQNPIPAPGAAADPGTINTEPYPRVEREEPPR